MSIETTSNDLEYHTAIQYTVDIVLCDALYSVTVKQLVNASLCILNLNFYALKLTDTFFLL